MEEKISIDKQKCSGCGSCVEICPYRLITLTDNKAEPLSEKCFSCGHCYAVCPTGAVQVEGLSGDLELAGVAGGYYKQGNVVVDLVELMRSRRSCRKYRDEEIPLHILKDLVKIGTTAPSGTNCQGWNFAILPSRKDVMVLAEMVGEYFRKLNRKAENPLLRAVVKILGSDSLGNYYRNYHQTVAEALLEWEKNGTDRLFHGATSAILVSCCRETSCPAEDALLATQNILLAAHSMGLGSCLIGFAVEAMRRDGVIRKEMKIPDNEQIYTVIALGVPDVHFVRPAGRREIEPRILQLTLK